MPRKQDILATIGTTLSGTALAGRFSAFLDACAESGWKVAVAALIAGGIGGAWPVLALAGVFGVSTWIGSRRGQPQAKALAEAMRRLESRKADVVDMLSSVIVDGEVQARLSRFEQQEIADIVAAAVEGRMEKNSESLIRRAISAELGAVHADLAQSLDGLAIFAGDTNERVRNIEAILTILLARVGGGAVTASSAGPTTNLTAEHHVRHRPFVGRVTELIDLHARLTAPRAAGDARPEAVVHAVPGEGGIGKTQLLLAYIIDFAPHWPRRWWVDGSAARFEASCKELAARLGLALPDDAPGDAVRAALVACLSENGPHLLVIDNAEPNGADDEPWRGYEQLTLAPPSRVLLSTRFTDRLEEFAEPFELGVLSPADARLLLRRARAGFADGSADAGLDAIAEELGCLGLALGYAAAWLTKHPLSSPGDLLAALCDADLGEDHPLEETSLKGRAGKYERSTAAALSLHLADLEGSPTMAVATAAAFCDPDRIPVAMLAAAAGLDRETTEAAVNALKGRSVLTLTSADDAGAAREDWAHAAMHRLTQSVLRARAWKSDRETALAILARLCGSIAGVLERREHHSTFSARVRITPHALALAAHLDKRLDDLPARAGAGLDRSGVAVLHRLVAEHLEQAGDLSTALAHMDAAVAWGEAQGADAERETAVLRASRATIRQDMGDLPGALEDITHSIEWGLRQRPVDERGIAIRRATRAGIRQNMGDLPGALEDITHSIEWGLRQRPVDERGIAIDRATRAGIRQNMGDLPGALEDITHSVEWLEAQTPRNEPALAFNHESRAIILARLGRWDEALAAIGESVRLHERVFGPEHAWTLITVARERAIRDRRIPD